MAKATLRNTHQEAVIKVSGGDATTETIVLADLATTPGQVLDGATQTVNIVGVTWTGQNATEITVTRNSVVVMTLPSTGSTTIDFGGQALPPENTENTSSIVVSIAGGQGEVWLKLRKVGGYKTTIEPEQFGPYDDPTVAGS